MFNTMREGDHGSLERARVALLGLSIGDAYGEAQFRASVATRPHPPERLWPWTDDTAMAISIVEVLARHGTIDPDALAEAFAARYAAEPDRGYGAGASNLLTRVAYGAPWRREAARMFDGRGSYGNGAAMRAAPIGAYFADDLARVRAEALRSAEPTHTHPDGAAGAVAVAIAAALATTRADPATWLAEVARHTPPGLTLDGLHRAAELPLASDPRVAGAQLGTGHAVAAHDTVPFCVWVAARHARSYEDAVRVACAQDGDRDTTAAIVGGIVVLATGVDAIPPAWRAATEPLPAAST